MGVHFDTSQVDRLAVDLSEAPGRNQRGAGAVLKKGALEVKKGMGKDFSGHSHAPHLGTAAFEFEKRDSLGLSYEIGELDSSGPQWGIAGIIAFGTSNNAATVDHTAALRRETPVIMRHLGDSAAAAVFGRREYTTRAGKTILATDAQIAHWTRGR